MNRYGFEETERVKLLHVAAKASFARQLARRLLPFGITLVPIKLPRPEEAMTPEGYVGVIAMEEVLPLLPDGYAELCQSKAAAFVGMCDEWTIETSIEFVRHRCQAVESAPLDPKRISDNIRQERGRLLRDSTRLYRYFTDKNLPTSETATALMAEFPDSFSPRDVKQILKLDPSRPASLVMIDERISLFKPIELAQALAYDEWYGAEVLVVGDNDSGGVRVTSVFGLAEPTVTEGDFGILRGIIERVSDRHEHARSGIELRAENGANETVAKASSYFNWTLNNEKHGRMVCGFGLGLKLPAGRVATEFGSRNIRALSSSITDELVLGSERLGLDCMVVTIRMGYKVLLCSVDEAAIFETFEQVDLLLDSIEEILGLSVLTPLGLAPSLIGRKKFQKQRDENIFNFLKRFRAI